MIATVAVGEFRCGETGIMMILVFGTGMPASTSFGYQ
jgi:hypothetical protein